MKVLLTYILFHSYIYICYMNIFSGTSIFFTGGPVWALAWLPIPSPMYSKKPHQYIAISTHPTMASEYTIGKSYTGHNMIQIWSVGHLDHELVIKKQLNELENI